jgi:dienelactone hydrolase
MDHLGIDKFMALGFCIGRPFIWNLLKRAPMGTGFQQHN